MSHSNRYPRRASLSGWWKCAPLIALPFGVLFFEAWLQTNILQNNYRVHELTLERRALETEVKELSDGRNRLSRIERIDAQAPRLGLVKPLPDQRRTVGESAAVALSSTVQDGGVVEEASRFAMARPSSLESRRLYLEDALPPMDGLAGTD
jgi:hypothetical protein